MDEVGNEPIGVEFSKSARRGRRAAPSYFTLTPIIAQDIWALFFWLEVLDVCLLLVIWIYEFKSVHFSTSTIGEPVSAFSGSLRRRMYVPKHRKIFSFSSDG